MINQPSDWMPRRFSFSAAFSSSCNSGCDVTGVDFLTLDVPAFEALWAVTVSVVGKAQPRSDRGFGYCFHPIESFSPQQVGGRAPQL